MTLRYYNYFTGLSVWLNEGDVINPNYLENNASAPFAEI